MRRDCPFHSFAEVTAEDTINPPGFTYGIRSHLPTAVLIHGGGSTSNRFFDDTWLATFTHKTVAKCVCVCVVVSPPI